MAREKMIEGLEYIYPEMVEGGVACSANITRAAKLILEAGTKEERERAEAIFSQVVDLEVAQIVEAFQKRIDKI